MSFCSFDKVILGVQQVFIQNGYMIQEVQDNKFRWVLRKSKELQMNSVMDIQLRVCVGCVILGGMYGYQFIVKLLEGFLQFFVKVEGMYFWDFDGNKYLDFMCGYGLNFFGYGY